MSTRVRIGGETDIWNLVIAAARAMSHGISVSVRGVRSGQRCPRLARSQRGAQALCHLARRASSMEIPAKVVGITSSVPSSSGGMNSEPSPRATGTVATIVAGASASATTTKRRRTTHRATSV